MKEAKEEFKEISKEFKSQKSIEPEVEVKILGELLRHLRMTKAMSLLMVCRQITSTKLVGNILELFSNDEQILELEKNEKYNSELTTFFKERNLGFKVILIKNSSAELDELKRLLGAKLIIKD